MSGSVTGLSKSTAASTSPRFNISMSWSVVPTVTFRRTFGYFSRNSEIPSMYGEAQMDSKNPRRSSPAGSPPSVKWLLIFSSRSRISQAYARSSFPAAERVIRFPVRINRLTLSSRSRDSIWAVTVDWA